MASHFRGHGPAHSDNLTELISPPENPRLMSHGHLTHMDPILPSRVRLRAIAPGDLPTMYQFNRDPAANRLAATIPRSAAEFAAHWDKVLADRNIVAKAISVDDQLAGYI